MSEQSEHQVLGGRPLCVFCMSPPYAIRSYSHTSENPTAASRRCSESCWRPDAHSFRSIRRFRRRSKTRRRQSSDFIQTVAGLFATNRNKKFLDLEDILKTVQTAWKSPDQKLSYNCNNKDNMEQSSSQKSSSIASNEVSPVLLRRRLSAPETVMRKHVLAQERSHSQDYDLKNSSWRNDMTASSDPNLIKKRDSSFMRKSTLLRRLWSNNINNNKSKPSKFSGSFSEWQYLGGKLSPGKSTQSLTSTQSSPEHKIKSKEFRGTMQRGVSLSPPRNSPKHYTKNINLSPKRSMSISTSNTSTSNSLYNSMVSQVPKSVYKEESESTTTTTATKYTYSSFSTFSDNSDSAFSNSSLTNAQSSNNNSAGSSETITKRYEESEENCNENCNETLQIQIEGRDAKDISNCATSNNETATQTPDITNLNVISNVKLSQFTLDVIFNQIMQEVNNLVPGDININTTTIATNLPKSDNNVSSDAQLISVKAQPQQTVPSFFLKSKEECVDKDPQHARLDKYIISNVRSGSCYSKPSDIPQHVVPRYSALPRTSSMEVNTSNGDSEEKEESDSVSLVDSLEDFASPRIKNHDEKIVRGLDVTQLLPENMEKKREKIVKKSPAMFFIPIEVNKSQENKAVSDLMPHKVREKLSKRQQKREEKSQHSKLKLSSDSNYMSASDNGTHAHLVGDTESDNNDCTSKKFSSENKQKFFLPNIDPAQNKMHRCKIKEKKLKPINRQCEENVVRKKHSVYTSASKPNKKKSSETLSPIYTKRNLLHDLESTRIYEKTEYKNCRKRIEILEVTECVDTNKKPNGSPSKNLKERSRIPVPVSHQSTQKNLNEHPFVFGFGTKEMTDSKLDQLIANILIDTLNNSTETEPRLSTFDNTKLSRESHLKMSEMSLPTKHQIVSRYQQKFEIIPEELSVQSSTEEQQNQNASVANENLENNNIGPYQGRAAVGSVQDENFAAIPKGWITFYTLHKDVGTPDSTSDEGKHLDNSIQNSLNMAAKICEKQNQKKYISRNTENKNATKEYDAEVFSAETEDRTLLRSRCLSDNLNQVNDSQDKYRSSDKQNNNSSNLGEWSVTISGTSKNNQSAPDVEMRLRFPQKSSEENNTGFASQSDLDSGIENNMPQRYSSCFPKINNKGYQNLSRDRRKNEREREIFRESLPRIQKPKQNQKESNPIISLYHNTMPSQIIPRENKASTGRYNFTRPIREQCHLPNVTSLCGIERQYSNIVQKFPDMLSVTGRSISPERKSTNASLSEREV